MKNRVIVVRGAGDLATGTIFELYQAGYHVLALECERPAAIRRAVCFGEAVYDGKAVVEGVTSRKIECVEDAWKIWEQSEIPVLVDPEGRSIKKIQPMAVVDLILAKKNLGTTRDMAPLVIGAGPGFTAGEDVDVVIETMRGYTPGKAIYKGSAFPNTGIPGMVGGFAKERVIHSPAEGLISHVHRIGEFVEKGEVIAEVGEEPVYASLTGILRGLIREEFYVKKGMKIADIDPRTEKREACYKRSDKAIAIGKGVLEVVEKHIRMQYLLQVDCEEHKVIALVGGGGKTTLIYALARELAANGKKVIVTTTTHMMKPTEKEIIQGVQTIGIPCETEPEKIKGLPEKEYEKLKGQCDILLVEADGSKRMPLKVPAEYEPVIPGDADLVIGIAGASAIGKMIKTCCHRQNLVSKILGEEETHVITEEDIAVILKSSQGQRKNVTVEYRMVVGQADLLNKKQRGKLEKMPEIILWTEKESYREIAKQLSQGKRVYRKTWIDEERCMEEYLTGGAFLVICGGGHISYPLCELAKMLDYHVVIIDDREEFANRDRFTSADEVYCMDFEKALENPTFPEHAFYVIVTRGHQKDYECLKAVLERKSGYIGMIGSRAKIAKTYERLKEDGFDEAICQKIHAPIGLPIGANTPEEIAVSISAEMIQEKSKMNGTEVPKEIVDQLISNCEEMVMMTIVSKKGSAPRGVGARMLVTKSGETAGTIGGGAIEHVAYQRALEMFDTEEEHVLEAYDLTTKQAVNLGMICGGYVEVLFEKIV